MAGPPGGFAAAAPPAAIAPQTPPVTGPLPLQSPVPRAGWAVPVPPAQKQATPGPDPSAAASRKRSCSGGRAAGRKRPRTNDFDQTQQGVERAGRHQCEERGDAEKHYFASWPCLYHSQPPLNRGTLLYRLPSFDDVYELSSVSFSHRSLAV